jgi:acetyltransferase-like isoleucine patch superfamily enzyme
MNLSFHYYMRMLMGHATCVKTNTTRLGASARITNINGPDDRITIGCYTTVRGELIVMAHGGRILIGDWCYVGEGSRIWSGAKITIGNRVLIAHNVNIFDNLTHPLDAVARHEQMKTIVLAGHPNSIDLDDEPVWLEDDSWIGASAIILKGVRVGKASIVAAGSVVTKDVPPYTVVAGNPAETVRVLSSSTEVDRRVRAEARGSM